MFKFPNIKTYLVTLGITPTNQEVKVTPVLGYKKSEMNALLEKLGVDFKVEFGDPVNISTMVIFNNIADRLKVLESNK